MEEESEDTEDFVKCSMATDSDGEGELLVSTVTVENHHYL